jgi:hypothetical protein
MMKSNYQHLYADQLRNIKRGELVIIDGAGEQIKKLHASCMAYMFQKHGLRKPAYVSAVNGPTIEIIRLR